MRVDHTYELVLRFTEREEFSDEVTLAQVTRYGDDLLRNIGAIARIKQGTVDKDLRVTSARRIKSVIIPASEK